MNRHFQSAVISCSVLAGALFLATSLSAQAPAGAPAGGAPAGGAPAAGGNRPAGGMGGGGMSINIEFYAPEDDKDAMANVQP